METLVATVLIVVVFMVSAMVLDNLFRGSMHGSTNAVGNELDRLRYLHGHGTLQLPYHGEKGEWDITVVRGQWQGRERTVLSATNKVTGRELEQTIAYE